MKRSVVQQGLVWLLAGLGLSCVSSPGRETGAAPVTEGMRAIEVDLAHRFQTIDNFGASDCWSLQMLGGWSDANKNRIADLLFSRDKGIGLSCWRFNIGAGPDHAGIDNPWRTAETFEVAQDQYDWQRQAAERWFLYAAKARGVEQFVAFVNSPPTRMTRNGLARCSKEIGSTNLKSGYEGQFAKYLVDILKHFREDPVPARRIAFDWISPINEPQWAWDGSGQEGMRAGNADLKAILGALDAELTRQGVATRILEPESGSLYGLYAECEGMSGRYGQKYGDYIRELCGDAALEARMGHVISGHSYFSEVVPGKLVPDREKLKAALDAFPDWRYWMTEFCIMQGAHNEGGGGRDLTIASALEVARMIQADLTVCNASAWHWWLALSNADYKDGLVYTDYAAPGDPETIHPSKTLWALGQFSKFVRPGARRVGLAGAEDIEGLFGSAFLDEARGGVIVVLVNLGPEIEIRLNVKGLAKGAAVQGVEAFVTSDAPGDDIRPFASMKGRAPLRIPARSVVTLRGVIGAIARK